MKPIAILFLASLGVPALACFAVSSKKEPVVLADEKILTIWDAGSGTQHLIREASFQGKAKKFGFIVPTPTVPTVAEAKNEVFSHLMKYVQSSPMGGALGGSGLPTLRYKPKPVEVIATYEVGDYEATVLKAAEGEAVHKWLKDNRFDTTEAQATWLDGYARRSWYFTAIKFAKEAKQGDQTHAIRISWKTDKPFHPFSMPRDAWPKNGKKSMALFFLTTGYPAARYAGTEIPWEATRYSAAQLNKKSLDDLAAQAGIDRSLLPVEEAQMTPFINTDNAAGFGRDVEFSVTLPNINIAKSDSQLSLSRLFQPLIR